MKKYFLYVIWIVFLISACKFNTQRTNNYSDKNEGERIVGTYFGNILLERQELNKNLFSEDFFDEINYTTFLNNQRYLDNKLGKVLGKELKSWETSVLWGTNSKSEYLFVYKVEREKYDSFETFYLIKDDNDSIKIRNYKLESEGLLKPDE